MLAGTASLPALDEQPWSVRWQPNLLSSMFLYRDGFLVDQAMRRPFLGSQVSASTTTLAKPKYLISPDLARSSTP